MIVTCPTLGCENAGIEIDVDEGPAVVCGPCGALLADSTLTADPPEPAPDPLAEVLARLAALEAATTP